jgi:energy-converting hydrogenase Eha subunit F
LVAAKQVVDPQVGLLGIDGRADRVPHPHLLADHVHRRADPVAERGRPGVPLRPPGVLPAQQFQFSACQPVRASSNGAGSHS